MLNFWKECFCCTVRKINKETKKSATVKWKRTRKGLNKIRSKKKRVERTNRMRVPEGTFSLAVSYSVA